MNSSRTRKPSAALDGEQLEALALRYAARYATSQARLTAYLKRKLEERGWSSDEPPRIDHLVSKLAALRYVDDEAFACMKSDAMRRRGLGTRRINAALRHDGIAEDQRMPALDVNASSVWQAADRLARRKRIGPYAAAAVDRPTREKHIAAFLRAGHDLTTARAWASALPDQPPPFPSEADD